MRLFLSSVFIMFLFTGCLFKSSPVRYTINNDTRFPNKYPYNYELNERLDYSKTYDGLLRQYKEWKGVKYKYGGHSRRGIDCSAFVQRTFRNKLDISIPRTTILQSKVGIEVSMEDIEIGDLVFFKTGFNTRHVGIYLGEGKFLHASTKKGVTISRLDNPYYVYHFWKIVRIIR